MKTIIFSRHAKSSWADYSLDDIDRPLNNRGKRDAPFMSVKLKEKIDRIDLCVSSPAKRAKATAKFYRKVFDFKKIMINSQVYEAGTRDLMEVLHDIEDKYSSVILFGHNPGFTFFYNEFSSNRLDNLPTSGVFCMTSTVAQWRDVQPSNTNMNFLIYPKLY